MTDFIMSVGSLGILSKKVCVKECGLCHTVERGGLILIKFDVWAYLGLISDRFSSSSSSFVRKFNV